MNEDIKSVLKKTAKIAGATCGTAAAVALVASGAALTAFTEGGKYLLDTIKRIVNEEDQASEAAAEETAAKEQTPVEASAEEAPEIIVEASAEEAPEIIVEAE